MSEQIWKLAKEAFLTRPKFLPKGQLVIIDAKYPPQDVKVKGQFGERDMSIVNTSDFGLIYVNGVQLSAICDALKNSNYENVTVRLP